LLIELESALGVKGKLEQMGYLHKRQSLKEKSIDDRIQVEPGRKN
jgi:hypothetical protein